MAIYSDRSPQGSEQQEKKRLARFIFFLVVIFLVSVAIYMLIHSQPV